MASAFARRELERRDIADMFDLVTGGTQPADHVHSEVIKSMAEVGIHISDQTPREVTFQEIQRSDYVIIIQIQGEYWWL